MEPALVVELQLDMVYRLDTAVALVDQLDVARPLVDRLDMVVALARRMVLARPLALDVALELLGSQPLALHDDDEQLELATSMEFAERTMGFG